MRILFAILLGIAGACLMFYGLNHLADYVSAWWRNRGSERASDLWILVGSIVLGLALLYPAARTFSARTSRQ